MISRRCILTLFAFLVPLTASRGAPTHRPNIVILLADDAGWGDYSFNGNRQLATPNIDSIAKAGASFDRFYVCPVCSPTRAELLTGRYHRRSGVYGVSTGQERLNLDENTFADSFKAAGYATGIFGKWHNGSQWPYHPMARGFDTFYGYTSGHWGEYFNPPMEHNGLMERGQGYIVDLCTDKALEFIEHHREKPFLCYVPFTTPHSPWSVPPADWARFKDKPISQEASNPKAENPDETRCALAMLENQDRNVGRLLKKLADLGLEENTIVIYFSDNGPNSARWNGGMKGLKASTDEGGVRSACFVRWPGRIGKGTLIEPIAGVIDLNPTLHALAGVKRVGDKAQDGRDLSPLLQKTLETQWPDRHLFSTWAGKVSVRTQQYRLDAEGNLFNMVADPGQKTPMQDKEPSLARELGEAVGAWKKDMTMPTLPSRPGSAVDPRPIPVGYREFPITMLPARDGEPRGEMRRSSKAPNSSYFVNWSQPTDSAVWAVEVIHAGTYSVSLDYTCPDADAGSTLELSFKGARLQGKVSKGWDPPLITDQDIVPRSTHGESLMKEFRSMHLGEIQLPAGRGDLVLRAPEIPGKSVMDLRRLTLTLR